MEIIRFKTLLESKIGNIKPLIEDVEKPIKPDPLSLEDKKKLSDLLWKKIQSNEDLKSHLNINDSFHTKENYLGDVSHKIDAYFDPKKKMIGLEFPDLGPKHNITFDLEAAPMTIFNNLKSNGNNPNQLKPKPMVNMALKIPLSDLLKKH